MYVDTHTDLLGLGPEHHAIPFKIFPNVLLSNAILQLTNPSSVGVALLSESINRLARQCKLLNASGGVLRLEVYSEEESYVRGVILAVHMMG